MEDVIFMQILSVEWHRPDLSEALDCVYNGDIHTFISCDSSKLTKKFPPNYPMNTFLKL